MGISGFSDLILLVASISAADDAYRLNLCFTKALRCVWSKDMSQGPNTKKVRRNMYIEFGEVRV
jgi:hypothetical protein